MSAVGEDHKRLLDDIELLDGLGAEAQWFRTVLTEA